MLSSDTRYVFNYAIKSEKYKAKLDINDEKLNPFILKHRHFKKLLLVSEPLFF